MNLAPASPLVLVAAALLGMALSPLAELAIARLLPRFGPLPAMAARITTAAITAALFTLLTLRFGISPELPAYLFLVLLGIQLARIDLQLHLLPNPLVLILLLTGLLLLGLPAGIGSEWSALLRAALGGLTLFAVYLILGLISPGGIGMGDVKLAAPLGVYLGYLGWSELFYGGALGFVAGGVFTVFVLRMNRGKRPSEVAHGPAMLAAALGVVLLHS